MPQGTTQRVSQMGPDARSGLSLARNGCRFRGLHSGVNDPGLPLHVPLATSPARSTFRLRNRSGLPPESAVSSPLARCRFRDQRGWLRFPPPLPFGAFTPLRIKAFSGICRLPARLPIRPITAYSPPPFYY
jgi:hypothetical protein